MNVSQQPKGTKWYGGSWWVKFRNALNMFSFFTPFVFVQNDINET